ncbi:MAG: NADH-quinone oxidoreductase subunit H, partial [archaeon GB-1867-035]|nr:NADH-quinone oxidoreductase subunit H [Candidatus Culexmicrobium profundum]
NPMAAITFLLSILGKLRLKPFDISEAEVEIVSGPCTEYSGKLLGLIYLSKYFMTVTLVAFFIDLFLAGGQISNFTLLNVITFIILTLIVTFILSLIHALMPRFKIDQAFKWVLTRMWPLSIISLIFSLIIRSLGVV